MNALVATRVSCHAMITLHILNSCNFVIYCTRARETCVCVCGVGAFCHLADVDNTFISHFSQMILIIMIVPSFERIRNLSASSSDINNITLENIRAMKHIKCPGIDFKWPENLMLWCCSKRYCDESPNDGWLHYLLVCVWLHISIHSTVGTSYSK